MHTPKYMISSPKILTNPKNKYILHEIHYYINSDVWAEFINNTHDWYYNWLTQKRYCCMKQREKCSGRGCESPQVHHKDCNERKNINCY